MRSRKCVPSCCFHPLVMKGQNKPFGYAIEIAVAWHCGLWTARTENTLQIEREL